jgi:hypothetical protein
MSAACPLHLIGEALLLADIKAATAKVELPTREVKGLAISS